MPQSDPLKHEHGKGKKVDGTHTETTAHSQGEMPRDIQDIETQGPILDSINDSRVFCGEIATFVDSDVDPTVHTLAPTARAHVLIVQVPEHESGSSLAGLSRNHNMMTPHL